MPLIVETGAGLSVSNSFVSLAECNAYHQSMGNTEWVGDDTALETALQRSTAYVSTTYNYTGAKSKGRSQALAWPRKGVADQEGHLIADNEIPREVVHATCEAALLELKKPGSLNVAVSMVGKMKSRTVGDVSTEFTNSSAQAMRPVLHRIDDLLSNLFASHRGKTRFLKRA